MWLVEKREHGMLENQFFWTKEKLGGLNKVLEQVLKTDRIGKAL